MYKQINIFFIFTFLLGCNIDYQPGLLKQSPILDINYSQSSFKDIQDSLIDSDINFEILKIAKDEILKIAKNTGKDNRFVLFNADEPIEYYVVHPIKEDSNTLYLINGAIRDNDGYTVLWEGNELTQSELNRIKFRISNLLK